MMRQFVGRQVVPCAASAGLVVRKLDCAKAGSDSRQSRSIFFMLMVFQSCRTGRTEGTMPNKPFRGCIYRSKAGSQSSLETVGGDHATACGSPLLFRRSSLQSQMLRKVSHQFLAVLRAKYVLFRRRVFGA